MKKDKNKTPIVEEIDHEKFGPMLDTFVSFASKKLGIKSMPNMKLTKDDLETTFGGYNPAEKSIVVVSKNRHPMDIFRTVAHELVHHKQNEDGRIGKDIAKEGGTGSDIENEANSEAGKVMRWFAKANPKAFSSSYVNEEKKGGSLSLKNWFDKSRSSDGKKGWVQVGGRYDGKPCARQEGQSTTPKCRSSSEAAGMTKKEKQYAFRKKQREDPNQPEKAGAAKPKMVKTYKHQNESITMDDLQEKKDACYSKVKSRYDVWPSAYASGALVKCRKVGAANWGNKSKKVDEDFENYISWGKTSPSDREWGKTSLSKIYKKETPGQGKKILKKKLTQEAEPALGYEFGNNGIGPTVGPTKTVGGIGTGFSLSMSEGRKSSKSLASIRESWDAKGGRDMGTVASTFKDEIAEEEDDKGVVNLSKARDDKKIKDFHKGFMGDMKDRANEYAERVQKHIDDGKFPMKVGDRFSTQHSRDNKHPPLKVTGYYVDKKNPDGHYGYHVERQVDGDVERSQHAIRNPNLEKLHGPKKWAELQSGIQKFEPLKSIKEGSEAWTRKEGKNPDGGLNKKGVASYRAANPGSKLQTAVTTEPSKLKAGSKKAKRRLSFCRRMKGMKNKLTSAKTARDPDSRINKSLRKWNCEE